MPDHGRQVITLDQIQRGICRGTSQRVTHERRTVHEHTGIFRTNLGSHLLRRHRGGETHVTARDRFPYTHDVRHDTRMIHPPHLTRASEAGGNLVTNQQHVVIVTQLPHLPQIIRRVKPHSPGTLHDRFQYHGSDTVVVIPQALFQFLDMLRQARFPVASFRPVDKILHGQCPPEYIVHSRHGVTHGHGIPRIPVVSLRDRQKMAFIVSPGSVPIL